MKCAEQRRAAEVFRRERISRPYACVAVHLVILVIIKALVLRSASKEFQQHEFGHHVHSYRPTPPVYADLGEHIGERLEHDINKKHKDVEFKRFVESLPEKVSAEGARQPSQLLRRTLGEQRVHRRDPEDTKGIVDAHDCAAHERGA